MPIAVTGGSQRFELKTLPEGFVVIKRMTHGQKLTRGSFVDKMTFKGNKKDFQGQMDLMQAVTTRWEWKTVIADHNLECYIDPQDPSKGTRLLNFQSQGDIDAVDANIAEEISTYIGKVNNFEDDFDDAETLLGKSA